MMFQRLFKASLLSFGNCPSELKSKKKQRVAFLTSKFAMGALKDLGVIQGLKNTGASLEPLVRMFCVVVAGSF